MIFISTYLFIYFNLFFQICLFYYLNGMSYNFNSALVFNKVF